MDYCENMCGFLGSITSEKINEEDLHNFNKRIECRGPDEKKTIFNEKFDNINFYHNFIFNRLSIIDLSTSASQPMFSKKFNTMIMFNGEIFNHKALRIELENLGIKFNSSHSDTETLLLGLSTIGLDFINKINGQFAIFFYDINKRNFYLIRDRVGQKPLYYSNNTKNVYFGSDLKSVKNLSKNLSLDIDQIHNYLNLGTTLTPNSFFKNVFSLNSGEYVKFSINYDTIFSKKVKYWDISEKIDEKPFIENEFVELFKDSVNLRLESDVPISNFLSGGLDSTAVIKAVKNYREEINTFSVISSSNKFNESRYIDQVVKKYDTNHTYKTINPDINFETIKSIVLKYDDIIYDPSLIPTFYLSEYMSQNYKVALSGDGGDELLSGYEHYSNYFKTNKYSEIIVNYVFKKYPAVLGTGNKILKNSMNWKSALSSYYEDKKLMNLLQIDNYSNFEEKFLINKDNSWKTLMNIDYEFFLKEMMLKKIDKSSMLNSLEVRSPFLDYRLAEYIISHKNSNSIENFSPKNILKNYLAKDGFNKDFTERKKMGFSIDIKTIVNNNMAEIIESIYYSSIKNIVDITNLRNLSLFPTRMNAIRIWKIYLLSLYVDTKQ